MGTEGYEELLRQIQGCFDRADRLESGSKERAKELLTAKMLLSVANEIRCDGEETTRKFSELEAKQKLYEETTELKKAQIRTEVFRTVMKVVETILNCSAVIALALVGYAAERDGSRISKWFDTHSRIGRP